MLTGANNNKMKSVLVTGGAGFIGSHLCEFLLGKGHHIICADNFFTGAKENIKHLVGNPNFEVLRHDICQPLFIEVDEIYNLACPASPLHYQYNPIKTIKTCTVGMVNMLGLARRCKAKLFQASTSEVYGDPTEHPQKETYFGNVNIIGPRSCYDEGKRVAESLCVNYNKQNNVDVRIARIFNTYGPRMALNDGRVVSNFIVSALQNNNIQIYGDGSQTRSFCFVSDLIDGIYRLMNSDETRPVNLGNPIEVTMIQLAEKIKKLTNSKSSMAFTKTLPENDPKKRQPDITLAKTRLGWEPTVSLENGLKETIGYFRQKLKL